MILDKKTKEQLEMLEEAIDCIGSNFTEASTALADMKPGSEQYKEQSEVVERLGNSYMALTEQYDGIRYRNAKIDWTQIIKTGLIVTAATGLNLFLVRKEENDGMLINKRAPRLDIPRP